MKIRYFIILACLCFKGNSQSLLLYSEERILYELNLNNCQLRQICELYYLYMDITFHPNGNFYGIRDNGRINKIDTLNAMEESVFTFDGSDFVGLTSSKDGVLYASTNMGDIWSYDLINGTTDSIGRIDIDCAGDMTFYNGDLYYAGADHEIVNIDLDSLENSAIIIDGSFNNGGLWGLSSIITDCNEVTTYATLSSWVSEWTVIYSINYIENSFDFECLLDNIVIFGSTAYNESYNSSEQFEEVSLESIQISQPDCDSMNGSIEIFASGNGTLLYSINGQNLSENNNYENLGEQLYFIEIFDQLGCSLDTFINLPCNGTTSSSTSPKLLNPFSFYPNPTDGLIYLERDIIPIETKLNLFSSSGKPQNFSSHIEGNKLKLDISFLAPGVYFLIIDNTISKIVKY